ncbi:GyrI-like domain-containing protein [Halorussus halophilus]|uniref:GyrI-like domain-containing protein n=1 Tax=Halorussus halophilus TaxID=2650975 RepID=UPI0013017DED|nr:GyrI-like domain-containing protein [Halorussus halophilus]
MLDPRFTQRDGLTVVGLHYRGTNEDDEISNLWEQTDAHADEFADLARSEEWFGLCFDFDHESGAFSYVAGVETESEAIAPSEMERVDVPGGEYAVFTTTLDTVGETTDEIYREWLPSSGYERADGPEVERYGESFDPEDANSEFEIFVPVEESND